MDAAEKNTLDADNRIEMVVCSFALHLVESSSELFSLLWELSTKSRWLIVIAPHKKPEVRTMLLKSLWLTDQIKTGWGWIKWNVDEWCEGQMNESKGELLHDRWVAFIWSWKKLF